MSTIKKRPRMNRIILSDEVKAKVREMYLANKLRKEIMEETGLKKGKLITVLNELFPDRNISEKLKKKYTEINNLYINGMLVDDIMIKLGVSRTIVYNAINRFQIGLRQPDELNKIVEEVKKVKPMVIAFSGKSKSGRSRHTSLNLPCEHCKKEMIIQVTRYKKLFLDTKKPLLCKQCNDAEFASKYGSSKSMMKTNTTGYIGVHVLNRRGEPLGYVSRIEYQKKTLFQILFSDKTLSDKTLFEAVVYREKYIINNDLPHTRNLSNNELISNMEMLGQYDEVKLIKMKLGI